MGELNVMTSKCSLTRDATMSAPVKPRRGQANKRERVRTENVNAGFENLRKLIPTDPVDRKLSKIEVLRLATSYINHLYNLTRAYSCLEAEALKDVEDSSSETDETSTSVDEEPEYDPPNNRPRTATRAKTSKSDVCTFCLMMTKLNNTPSSSRGQK